MKIRVLLIALSIMALGCPKNETPNTQLELIVAASLLPATSALAKDFQKTHGLNIQIQSGASSLVARQIVNGLPCDVVILADTEWMDYLVKNSAVESKTVKPLLGNQLVSIANKNKVATLKTAKRVAVCDPDHVPAGKYAKFALSDLGLWNEISPRIMTAPDVRTALLWVEREEADAGIVYESDALSSTKVVVTSRFDASKDRPIRYPIAQCLSKKPHAKILYELLASKLASDTFLKFGFQIVKSTHEPL